MLSAARTPTIPMNPQAATAATNAMAELPNPRMAPSSVVLAAYGLGKRTAVNHCGA